MKFKELTTTKDFSKFYHEVLVPCGELYEANEGVKNGHHHRTKYIAYNTDMYYVMFTDGKITTIKRVVG